MRRQTLVLMVKEPRPGRVKTRLAAGIGSVPAAWWFRHQTARLIRSLRDPRWRLVLAVSPDREGLESRVWPADLPRLAQGRGDLGARMMRVFHAAAPGRTLIVGGDIPGITRAHVARGFAALGRCEAVLGPAEDGGYWAIGLRHARRLPRGALAGVRWSTSHALADTEARLSGRLRIRLDRLADVDEPGDLPRREIRAIAHDGPGGAC